MVEQLLQKVFDKAEELSGKKTVNGKAEYLSGHLLDELRFSISAKSLIRYYREESSPGPEVRDHLAKFLHYRDYEDFILHHSAAFSLQKSSGKPRKLTRKKGILALLIFPVVGLSAYVGYRSAEQDCMVWKEDHFEQVNCSGFVHEKRLDPLKLENFKQIQVSDTTEFFRDDQPQVWYDKSNGHLEYFSAPGIHPENGKTLKPITEYMIQKYIRN